MEAARYPEDSGAGDPPSASSLFLRNSAGARHSCGGDAGRRLRRAEMGDGASERYRKLGFGEALGRACDYAPACIELSFILRGAYSRLPKHLQSLVFQDTLAAFRLLPDVQTSSGTSAAHLLYQASEASLPKQRKAMAVSKFKHAVVAQKRRCKVREDDEGTRHLPQDILVHIFSLLDMQSLMAAGSVCRSWNSAANDNTLWQLQYSLLFGNCNTSCKSQEQMEKSNQAENLDWKKAFKRKYICHPSWRYTATRAYCGHCMSILWMSNLCLNSHECCKLVNQQLRLKPFLPSEVVKYLLGEPTLDASDSSDSDSDESFPTLPKLWAYPALLDW